MTQINSNYYSRKNHILSAGEGDSFDTTLEVRGNISIELLWEF
jgi:hypothetical protein